MNAHPTATTGTDHGVVRISHGRAWIDQAAGVRIGYVHALDQPADVTVNDIAIHPTRQNW